jgi:hypothetical protein
MAQFLTKFNILNRVEGWKVEGLKIDLIKKWLRLEAYGYRFFKK